MFFIETIPCVHSATMDFIEGVNTILNNEDEDYEKIVVEIGSGEEKIFNVVKKNYSTY